MTEPQAPRSDADGPNAEMIAYWNESAARRWVDAQALLDAQLSPIGLHAIERAGVSAGERVIDVGCGCGETTLQLADAVGAGGSVLGVDVSAPMLARAAERASAAGLAQARFECADAQTHRFAGDADLVFSRFGVMFFAEPETAFANLRSALAPGGRIAFACWQELQRNPWMFVPVTAAAPHLELQRPSPGAPGPFAMADPERVRAILDAAGFVDADLEDHAGTVALGDDLDVAVPFVLGVGPLAAALWEAPEKADAVEAAVRGALAPFATPEGVRLDAATWIVQARNPD